MKQGSTFVLIIDLDIDIGRVDSIIFTLKNKGNILTKEDWNFSDGKFKIPFTQEETVRLIGRTLIEAQVNFKDGNVSKSDIKEIFIKESLATKIIDGNNATEEHGEIELVIDGDVVYQGEDYTYLVNKPKINGVVLVGNVSPDALNLATKEYVEREIATFDFIKIVDELPEVGLPNREYFVRKQIPNQNDLFDEWAWVNNDWEFKGTKTVEVDLDDYVKKDDFATRDKLGLVYANPARGISVTTDGGLIIEAASSTDVDNRAYYIPITGRILDYAVMKALTDPKNHEWTDEQKQLARALLGSVGSGDYAGVNKSGVVKVFGDDFGWIVNSLGYGMISQATEKDIDEKSKEKKPITPKLLDYAVKKALSDCKLEGDDVWTEEEKAKALETLGGLQKIVSADSLQRVYAIGQDGTEKTLKASENPFSSALVLFDAGGCVKVNAPTKDNHATTKKYVDDLVCSTKDSIALKDASTGQVYNIRINNGVLEMVLVDEEVE